MQKWLIALTFGAACAAFSTAHAQPQVAISELMYHPIEEPAFDRNGKPVLDLSEDVHEFVEIHNTGFTPVALDGWKLAGGISYTFPAGALLQPGEYRVIAKDPTNLAAVAVYQLNPTNLFGPYAGKLGNNSDTVRLKDKDGNTVDSVSYSAQFPWAISADAFGAGEDWTGIDPLAHQYRGRSLERVSFTDSGNDPANWLASPMPGEPSPGRANAISRPKPKPVVTAFSFQQSADEQPVIRNNQPVRIDCAFSATNDLSAVAVEWFIDDIEVTNEAHTTSPMSVDGAPGEGKFTLVLPGQPDRSVVRFRFLANRGGGMEVVSPRPDDPYSWHAYFVTPIRNSSRPVYDVFVSSASLAVMNQNISQSPKRVTSPDPPGYPRESWNATEPAIFVVSNVVRDIRIRYHGSRYNRNAGRQSYKFKFPRYNQYRNHSGLFVTDKGNDQFMAHALFRMAGIPSSTTPYVDLYLNNNSVLGRQDQEENDDGLLERYQAEQHALHPGQPLQPIGEIYKCEGTIDENGEGPYGRGDARLLPAIPPYWSVSDRYDWTYALQDHGWKGSYYFRQMIEGMWAARGDTYLSPNPDIPALRAWFLAHWDVDKCLTYIALENWMGPWDDTTQNYHVWQQANGLWSLTGWDFDGFFSSTDASIFAGEVGDRSNNFRGPNFFKDSFIKAFREELKQRAFLLNNTLLLPSNLRATGFSSIAGFADQRFVSVNQQCGYGEFQRPNQPVNLSPGDGLSAFPPMTLQASAYGYSANPVAPHASTTWMIRDANGDYTAPVFNVTTSSNLTSLPIPFEILAYGRTYFWKCLYNDSTGHPSFASDETSFVFGPASSSSQLTLIPVNSSAVWKYNQSGTDLSQSNWTAPGYNDNAWPSGAPVLAYETGTLPEPIRTTLTLGEPTYYFRKHFNFTGDPQGASLSIQALVDDGMVVYLNGVEVYRLRMDPGPVGFNTFSSGTVVDAVYEGPDSIPSGSLVQGDNVIAVEVHQNNAGSPDITFALELDASVANVNSGGLVLNEIMADNFASVTNGGATPDWIELFNNTTQPIDLGGMSLSDNVLNPNKYMFPSNTVIAAQGYLTVWCDDATNAPGLHTGFGLDKDGQTVVLLTAGTNGYTVADSVTFGLQVPDYTIGRITNGTGGWQLNIPTFGAPNQPQPVAASADLKVNEWMASPSSGDDWFELFNPDALPAALGGLYVTDSLNDPTNSRLTALSFIAPGGFAQFFADQHTEQGATHVDFKLSANGEDMGLFAADGSTRLDSVTFGPQLSGVSQGLLPDGGTNVVSFPGNPTPKESNFLPLTDVVVNEVLTRTDLPFEDAIELRNLTGATVNLGGWWLSDSLDHPRKYQIPAGDVLPANGFKVYYEYQFNADTNAPTSFSLNSAHGDQVYLFAADANGALTGYRASAKFGAAENGVSFGRFETSVGVDFPALSQRTFGMDNPATVAEFRTGTGLSNAYPKVGPLVINEIMYHPADVNGADNTRDEFIELQNITDTDLSLFDPAYPTNTWNLRDAVDFTFPTNVTVPPGAYVLVVSFDPTADPAALDGFRSAYTLDGSVPVYGPYSGKLNNSSDSVELTKPGSPQGPGPDAGFVPSILIDKVEYADHAPWPAEADGSGPSLQRISGAAYGNDPANWFISGVTPGATNLYNSPPSVAISSPTNLATFQAPVDITVAGHASDSDGSVLKVELLVDGVAVDETATADFTLTWTNAVFGTHALTARATDSSLVTQNSAPVVVTILPPPPSVVLTDPAEGATYTVPATVTLAADAQDPNGSISRVEFLANGARLGEANGPFTYAWSNSLAGDYALQAIATDNDGNTATSVVVNVTFTGYVPLPVSFVASGAAWKYLDTGSDPGSTWMQGAFNDTGWSNGPSPLGYAARSTMGLNFAADEAGANLQATDVAGIVPAANWNNLTGPGGTTANLVKDSAGNAVSTTATVTWTANGTWASTGRGEENNNFTGVEHTLMTGYLDTGNATTSTIMVSGLPPEFTSGGYDIYVYAMGGVAGRGGSYQIGNQFKLGDTPGSPNNGPTYVEDPGVDHNDSGNYLFFTNFNTADFTLDASTANGGSGGTPRAPVNAIQIVQRGQASSASGFGTVVRYGPDANTKLITTWFRKSFTATNLNRLSGLTLRLLRDDGAVVYLNGTEIFRSNLPNGPITAGTLALSDANGADETTHYYTTNLPPQILQEGTNVLAVEVHQASATSSDLVFDLELTGLLGPEAPLITTQPASQTVAAGSTALLSVEATGTAPLRYQWLFNGAALAGATSSTLTLANMQPSQAGAYAVIVTNIAGSATSDDAILTVPSMDRDSDGLPDAWETAHGLNPDDPNDAGSGRRRRRHEQRPRICLRHRSAGSGQRLARAPRPEWLRHVTSVRRHLKRRLHRRIPRRPPRRPMADLAPTPRRQHQPPGLRPRPGRRPRTHSVLPSHGARRPVSACQTRKAWSHQSAAALRELPDHASACGRSRQRLGGGSPLIFARTPKAVLAMLPLMHPHVPRLLFILGLMVSARAAETPPVIPTGYDAYRLWEQWPVQRFGARTYMRSTYDRRGGNESADASHFLYQLNDDFNVSLDVAGAGILYFARFNHWHGSPWHFEVDGTDHVIRETTTADPNHPAPNSTFLPAGLFPEPLAWTWAATKGADLTWVPIPFTRRLRLAYSRTHYGTGYYIYQQFVPGAALSQPLTAWTGSDPPPQDVLDLVHRAGTDLAPNADQPGVEAVSGDLTCRRSQSITFTRLKGPAVVRALEFRVPEEQALAFGQARLRITWDERDAPSIEAPLALFFGAGTLYNRDQRPYLVKAFPTFIRTETNVVHLACFFPMPFFHSATLELQNTTTADLQDIRWAVRTTRLIGPTRFLTYFHATYRDFPQPEPGRDLVVLDTRRTEGGGDWSGHFAGMSWIFSHRGVLNTLEGDPRFFFDDSQTPQAYGTGTEEWGGGGDYWGGENMTLPFAGHPTGARKPEQAKDPEDLIESAYRFLLADLMPFGKNALIRLEHGGQNDSAEHYETVAFWYGTPSPTLVQTDHLDVGDAASEKSHDYESPQASEPVDITSRYEWGVDHLRGQEIYPAHTDRGRITTGRSEFRLAVRPDNWGAVLRRKLDYSYPNQRAVVWIADGSTGEPEWKPAGTWYLAGGNTCVFSNPKDELGATKHHVQTSNRRFRDDEFLIPRHLTRGRSSIRVRLEFQPVETPLFPGQPLPELAWSELDYTIYSYVLPEKLP